MPKDKLYTDYGVRHIANSFIKEDRFKELGLSTGTVTKVLNTFNQLFGKAIIEESKEMYMPNMGYIRIKKSKLDFSFNKLKIDWKLTKQYGKTIYHTNDHRDGFKYKFLWQKAFNKNLNYYSFTPARKLKRHLAKILKTTKIDYFE